MPVGPAHGDVAAWHRSTSAHDRRRYRKQRQYWRHPIDCRQDPVTDASERVGVIETGCPLPPSELASSRPQHRSRVNVASASDVLLDRLVDDVAAAILAANGNNRDSDELRVFFAQSHRMKNPFWATSWNGSGAGSRRCWPNRRMPTWELVQKLFVKWPMMPLPRVYPTPDPDQLALDLYRFVRYAVKPMDQVAFFKQYAFPSERRNFPAPTANQRAVLHCCHGPSN